MASLYRQFIESVVKPSFKGKLLKGDVPLLESRVERFLNTLNVTKDY